MSPRAAHIFSGIGVMLTSIVYVHLLHHLFIVHRHDFPPVWWAVGLAIMIPIGILSFIGAYLLITGGRLQNSQLSR